MKKMNNKGFSLVELIIVIAIMAILAGALAPALINYVAKSRRSSDVSNAQTVASAVQSAISDETGMDALEKNYATIATTPIRLHDLVSATDDFATTVNTNLSGGIKAFETLKSTKTAKKASDTALQGKAITKDDGFYISIDPASSTIKVYVKTSATPTTDPLAADGTSATTGLIEVYPSVNDCMTK